MRTLTLLRNSLVRTRTCLRPEISCRFKSDGGDRVMQQVDVDDPRLQAQLGKIQMNIIRKAEEKTEERVAKYKKYRRTDLIVAGTCVSIALGIYAYTMFAIKQENFLDDFEVPNPLPEEDEK